MRLARHFLDDLWLGTVLLILFSTLLAMALSVRGLLPQTAGIALPFGALAAAFAVWKQHRRHPCADGLPGDHWLWRWAACICFSLFALRAFSWLIFQKEEQIAVLSRNNLGDLPLHIQYIQFFAHGAPLWPANPIHAHSTIGYPFGMDYFNAILDVCGFPLWHALIITGLVCSLATGIALHRWGRAFGLAGFLFNGGAAGLAIFATAKWEDYQAAVDWKNIPLALFVTQRGFLYALPAGLLLLTHWRGMLASPEASSRRLPLSLQWLIYATMPLFHIHTFIFLSAMLAGFAFFGKNKQLFWWLGIAAFFPATGLVWLLTDGFRAASHLAWLPGWMQGETFSASYWLRNFGALPFFAAWLVYILVRKRASAELIWVLPALGMFVMTLFIKFSPWEWDNTKLMMWSYLVILPFLWKALLERTHILVRATSCFLLFASGFVSLFGGLGSGEKGYEIADGAAALGVAQTVKGFPILETFAAAPGYAHPLVFAGRRLALGYHGHMVGHGIPYDAEKKAMDRLMLGAADWQQAAATLGVRYIYWGPEEERTWPKSEKPWVAAAELVATESWGEIYKLP